MGELYKKQLLDIKPYKPGKPIEEVKRELGLSDVIKLASNENPFPPSAKVMAAIRKSIPKLNRYPEGSAFYLKKALSSQFDLPVENIAVSNGSDEMIVLALKAFINPGDEVIIAKPTFLVYEIASTLEGVKINIVPTRGFRYDLEAMAEKINQRTKLIFIANPDNPNGTYVSGAELDKLMSKVSGDTIVFLDEAYYEFARAYKGYPESFKYLKAGRNVIISRTFSKVYGLAGLRLGYAFARKGIIEGLDKAREPFNVNSLAQVAGVAALKDQAYVKKCVRLVEQGKKLICDNLDRLGVRYVPSATNFILMDIGDNALDVYEKLLRKGIIVREMTGWGMKGFLRVTIGKTAENRRFVKALSTILEKCKGR